MKNFLIILLITCVCLSTISCATKSNDSAKGVFFYRESFGEWGWHEDGDEEKDGIYEGEMRKRMGYTKVKPEKGNRMDKEPTLITARLNLQYYCCQS